MTSLPLAVWIAIAAVAAIVLAVTVLLLTRRRHVEIEAPSLSDPVIGPTLVRDRPKAVAFEDAIPPAIPATADSGPGDNLLRMKGIGPRLATRLNALDITRYDQIAAWTDDDIAAIDARLGTFAGRIDRDRWVEQARYLATDDIAGFEAQFGKINGGPGAPDAGA